MGKDIPAYFPDVADHRQITVRAPAKLNLALSVGPPGADRMTRENLPVEVIGEMIVVRDDREALRTRSRRKIRKDRCARDVAETATDLDVQVPATGNLRIGVHAIDKAPG